MLLSGEERGFIESKRMAETEINIIKDDRIPQGFGVMGEIKTFPEGNQVIRGVVIDFREREYD